MDRILQEEKPIKDTANIGDLVILEVERESNIPTEHTKVSGRRVGWIHSIEDYLLSLIIFDSALQPYIAVGPSNQYEVPYDLIVAYYIVSLPDY